MRHRVTERWLRRELTSLREQHGWTARKVASAAGVDLRTIERIERGPVPVSLAKVSLLCDIYNVDKAEREKLQAMQAKAREIGWWNAWNDVPFSETYQDHCELEEIAEQIDLYSTTVFHGLVQSPAYAELIQSRGPRFSEGAMAERFTALRVARQEHCLTPGKKIRHVFGESALTKSESLREQQINHLLAMQESGVMESRFLPNGDSIPPSGSMFTYFRQGTRKVCCLSGSFEHHTERAFTNGDIEFVFQGIWQNSLPLEKL